MAKETPNRSLFEILKGIRSPLRNGANLRSRYFIPSDKDYGGEVLQEMIAQRQRNNMVRRREFDMLRKLRRRETGEAPCNSPAPSFGVLEGRIFTLRKIDEIEAQMTRQCHKALGPSVLAESRIDDGGKVHADALKEASQCFAAGDDSAAEAVLLQLLTIDAAPNDSEEAWHVLLDLYRALGDEQAFNSAVLRYGITYEVVPHFWCCPRVGCVSLDRLAVRGEDVQDIDQPALTGLLMGDVRERLRRLDIQMAQAGTTVVSCVGLLRVDLRAADSLLDWVKAHNARGRRIEFTQAHRLIEILFHATGIATQALLTP